MERAAAPFQSMRPAPGSPPIEWRETPGLTPYVEAIAAMEQRVEAIARGQADELVWLLEHPALYTAGTSARADDLLDPRLPVFWTGRGGQFTYHGPGQRIAYVMLDLKRRRQDVRAFVCALESWIIATLAAFGVCGERRSERVGVWVASSARSPHADGQIAEDKIAAIGVRLRRWVTFHGLAINVAPDLAPFAGIVPCGIAAPHLGVTSLRKLGVEASMEATTAAMRRAFEPLFGDLR